MLIWYLSLAFFTADRITKPRSRPISTNKDPLTVLPTITKAGRAQTIRRSRLTQKDLAREVDVTAQAVTNWMKGTDFPRPDKLLKLATTLKLGFAELVVSEAKGQPAIAFRKKGAAKTTDSHTLKAIAMGSLLKPS